MTEKVEDPRVTKRNGVEYGDIYKVNYPIEFFFNKDGTYDGLVLETDNITDIEADLIEELLDRLANVQDLYETHRKLTGSKTFKECKFICNNNYRIDD